MPAVAEQRRKHAPISYKPPERHLSDLKQDKPNADPSKAAAVDGKDVAAKAGVEQQTSGLDRSVSRTESGHKLSVFERLRRYGMGLSNAAFWRRLPGLVTCDTRTSKEVRQSRRMQMIKWSSWLCSLSLDPTHSRVVSKIMSLLQVRV